MDRKKLLNIPFLGKLLLLPYRFRVGFQYVKVPLNQFLSWLFASNETTNFTYDLEDLNRQYLSHFIAGVCQKSVEEIEGYLMEIEQNHTLKSHIQHKIAHHAERYKADPDPKFGRRIGWYAFVRALKPKIVIETGVDKGAGSCIITSALIENEKEGFEGRYYGTDINPDAGYLFTTPYSNYGEILYGDSIESLTQFDQPIDLFINDSDHSAEYEAGEYEVVQAKLSENAVILGDNSELTDKLLQFSIKAGRQFQFFQEKPKKHWYPGGGIGVSY